MANESSELMRFLGRFDSVVHPYRNNESVSYVEVPQADWTILMKEDDFRDYVSKNKIVADGKKMQEGNIGGYKIRQGKELIVHLKEEEQEKV